MDLLEFPSWKLLDTWDAASLGCLSPGARFWGAQGGDGYGFSLGRWGENRPLVTLGIDSQVFAMLKPFSDDGRLVAWGNTDGTVHVCDIHEVQRRLAAVELGWE